ncbi:MAG: bifunctional transaldolase/phosoglucose isomerase [Acidobacteria bacterium]|nr:bifunctional transaldolase/phosoglucose isomerase [Acidobacteriota bacterium]
MSTQQLPKGTWTGWKSAAEDWRSGDKTTRLFARDASLWTSDGEQNWLGWLDVADRQLSALDDLVRFQQDVLDRNFQNILLLGMGGSSLCPDVFSKTFGPRSADGKAFPKLHVVDSTDPRQVQAAADAVDVESALVFVSSKSGSTLEPDILRRYFFDRFGENAGDCFVAVTDPGSQLEATAKQDGYWRLFYGEPQIGGRYSALSAFGMAPAAAMGLDVGRLLRGAAAMADQCRKADPEENPGVSLGLFLGWNANEGRDKVTFLTTPGLRSLGGWLEQLLAESTGKHGKAIIPVDLEPVVAVDVYGKDRVFVSLQLDDEQPDESFLAALEGAGHPVVRIHCPSRQDLAAEMYRWEIATAVAGAVMQLNPFDQPDVEASKIKTKELMRRFEETGKAAEETPFATFDGIELYADEANAKALAGASSLEGLLAAHFARLGEGDYFGLLAYLPMFAEIEAQLTDVRAAVLEARHTATCMGFGPRFLHSTGQAYKGGPNSGVFLQVTAEAGDDLPVPGRNYTFGLVQAAQARGDLGVLDERGRRALRVHLPDLSAGLARFVEAAVHAAKA